MSSPTTTWHSLPAELALAVVDALEPADVRALSRVDQRTYRACVPALFNNVTLHTIDAAEAFLEAVPRAYLAYIAHLDLCTAPANPRAMPMLARARSDIIINFLTGTARLSALTLRVAGSLDKSVVAPFPYLHRLTKLSIANVGDEARAPLSERLVVAIAFSVPHLASLSLARITRSAMHATDLAGVCTYVPLATADADVSLPAPPPPPAAVLPVLPHDTPLSLPTLLLLPHLKRLALKDTHLGDPRWGTVVPRCRLTVLDLGTCVHEEAAVNARCTARIVSAVGNSLSEVGIGSALSEEGEGDEVPPTTSAAAAAEQQQQQQQQQPPLAALRKLHISPFFPLERVVDTMSALAASPVESVRIECFPEDVVDVCARVEEFLTLRSLYTASHASDASKTCTDASAPAPAPFFARLQTIWVGASPAAAEDGTAGSDNDNDDDDDDADEEEREERRRAARRLERLCAGLKLRGVVQDRVVPRMGRARARAWSVDEPVVGSPEDATRRKGRAMTL